MILDSNIDWIQNGERVTSDNVNRPAKHLLTEVNRFLLGVSSGLGDLDCAVVIRGDWDASVGTFPEHSEIGDTWIVSVQGVVDGTEFEVGDRLMALIDNASTTEYKMNWVREVGTAVSSVNGKTGNVTLELSDIVDSGTAAGADLGSAGTEIRTNSENEDLFVLKEPGKGLTDINFTEELKNAILEAYDLVKPEYTTVSSDMLLEAPGNYVSDGIEHIITLPTAQEDIEKLTRVILIGPLLIQGEVNSLNNNKKIPNYGKAELFYIENTGALYLTGDITDS